MTEALIEAGTLTANLDERTVTALLVPYGEVGRTNLGRFSIPKGNVTIPRDPSVVMSNRAHKREFPTGPAVSLVDTDKGVVSTFRIADTEEGDELLAEIDEKRKAGTPMAVSSEIRDVVLRAGQLVSGVLFGGAFVDKGAFPSAALLASDIGEPEDDPQTPETAPAAAATQPEEPAPTKEDDVTVATVPNTLGTDTTSSARPAPLTASDIGAMLYAAHQGTLSFDDFKERIGKENGSSLFAALSDVKYDGTGGIAGGLGITPQWIGEVWQAVNYRQQILPLFGHKDLTSLTMNGFKWTTKPAGGDWAGNKANVPSNTLVVAAVTGSADRYAVGHDIAREFVDFPVPGFFESYAAAVGEDYAKWADGKVAASITAGATTLAADALTTLPGPTGGTIGSAASAIIDGATVLVNNGVLPSFALLAPALWKQMAKMPKTNVLGYLNAALGLSEGDLDGFVIRPSSSVATGKVLVGAKEAVTVYELPGAPIRIDALDLARGGIDKAAFGYVGTVINDARGLQLVTAATS